MQGSQRKFIGIELLRFLCAFSIIVIHSENFILPVANVAYKLVKTIDFPLYQFFYKYIRQSVELFWTMSGFVLFMRYAEAFYEKKVSLKDFAVIRLSRLYPLHFLTLFLVIILQLLYHYVNNIYFFYTENFDLYHFFLHLFLASHWGFENGYSFNQPVWSISVENIACLIYFLVAFSTRLTLLKTLMLVIAFCFVYYQGFIIPNVMKCIVLFFSGGLMYQIFTKIDNIKIIYQKLLGWLGFLVVLALVVAYQTEWGSYFRMGENQFQLFIVKSFIVIPAVILFFIFVVDPSPTSYVGRFIQWLGRSTFATYLIHFPMQILFVLVSDKLHIPREAYTSLPLFSLYLLCVYGSAFILYYKYEKPATIYLRNKFIKRK